MTDDKPDNKHDDIPLVIWELPPVSSLLSPIEDVRPRNDPEWSARREQWFRDAMQQTDPEVQRRWHIDHCFTCKQELERES